MPWALAASTLQDGAGGATALEPVAGDAFMTRENLGSGRLLGGGASACSRSWTKFLATSCSRSSSASVTTGASGRGVARSSGFFFCALGASVVDGGGGLAGLLLLSLSRRAGAGAAAAAGTTVVVTAAPLPARGAGGGGGGAAGRQGKMAYLVAVGGSGRSGGWLDGRRGRDGDEYIGGLAYGSAGAEGHAPPLCRWLYGWSVGKEPYAPPGPAGLAPSPRRLRPRDLFGNSRLPDDRSRRTFSILLI
jgi:hypothetical protein